MWSAVQFCQRREEERAEERAEERKDQKALWDCDDGNHFCIEEQSGEVEVHVLEDHEHSALIKVKGIIARI
jgi:hypothetical protein